jgi:hypothetical protein
MRIASFVMLSALCTLAACSPGNGLTMGRVSGLVTYKGEPVEMGEVLFVPDSSQGNKGVPSMGAIQKDGSYVMSTQEPGDGVIAGFHKVGIRVLDPTPVSKNEEPAPDANAVDAQYGMKARVLQKKAQALKMRKNRARPDAPTVILGANVYRFMIPKKLADPETSGLAVRISTGSNRVNFAIQDDGSVTVSQ